MKGYLLDTNVVAEITSKRPDPRVTARLASLDESKFWISIVTLAEQRKGIAQLQPDDPRRLYYQTGSDQTAALFHDRILSVSDDILLLWGRITGDVRRMTGHPPPPIDTLIAATAIAHDLVLLTRNIRDVRHSGATLLNPWEPQPPA